MAVTEQPIAQGTWQLDTLHSSVGLEVQHLGLSNFRAGFTDFAASLTWNPEGLAIRGAVNVESFDVDDDQLRPHVLAPDFLDAERHPKLTFESTGVREEADGLVVDGDLTIKGATRTVQAYGGLSGPLVDPFGNSRLAVRLETVIDRTEFGLGWQMELPDGGQALANEVRLVADLEFVKDA
jgi:polyisoprenoid-binding protein YceI